MLLAKQVKYHNFFTGHLQGIELDPYMIITRHCESQGVYGYWMQPLRDDSTEYLQSVWMMVQ